MTEGIISRQRRARPRMHRILVEAFSSVLAVGRMAPADPVEGYHRIARTVVVASVVVVEDCRGVAIVVMDSMVLVEGRRRLHPLRRRYQHL